VAEGAYDFFIKPIQLDELKVVIRRAFMFPIWNERIGSYSNRAAGLPFAEMLGRSPQMEEVHYYHSQGGDNGCFRADQR